MVRIRLKRFGTKKRPYYRVIVIPSQRPRQGRAIEEIGVYQPLHNPSVMINAERFQYWTEQGAIPSDTVRNLMKQNQFSASENGTRAATEKQQE